MLTPDYIGHLQQRASAALLECLQKPGLSARLEEAVLYAVHNGGKRIRPVLAYAGAEAVGGTLDDADTCACAVELIHAYSLVHDDLPAMDNDDLRRGLPTCHVRFDEATAILAGDALQALAFELLATDAGKPATSLAMIATLAKAAGWAGMVGGQSLDIDGAGSLKSEQDLALMHGLKTGALIRASVLLGAQSTGRASGAQLASLDTFARCIGLAFQVKDDILDVEGDTEVLGKQQGKDQARDKPTYAALLGVAGARAKMQSLLEEGNAALADFGASAAGLKGVAAYIIERSH